jgi:hypothetical protein
MSQPVGRHSLKCLVPALDLPGSGRGADLREQVVDAVVSTDHVEQHRAQTADVREFRPQQWCADMINVDES